MAFVKEFREFEDEMPEWEYFNSLGIRRLGGKPLMRHTFRVIVDKDRNYYLVPQGHTGIAYQDEDISYYTLVLDGLRIELEVIDAWCNDSTKQYVEYHWHIKKIDIIDDPIREKYSKSEILEIIKEAFTAESTLEPGITKKRGVVEVIFEKNMEINW